MLPKKKRIFKVEFPRGLKEGRKQESGWQWRGIKKRMIIKQTHYQISKSSMKIKKYFM